jgi:hypothetical protein
MPVIVERSMFGTSPVLVTDRSVHNLFRRGACNAKGECCALNNIICGTTKDFCCDVNTKCNFVNGPNSPPICEPP